MKYVHNQPITGAKPNMSPRNLKQMKAGKQAQKNLTAPPAPFQNPMGPANAPAGSMMTPRMAGQMKAAPDNSVAPVGGGKGKRKGIGAAFYGEY